MAASRAATMGNHGLIGNLRAMMSNGVARGMTIGLLPHLIASTPSNAVYLGSYHIFRPYFYEYFGEGSHAAALCSAFGAVSCTNVIMSPFFVVRTRSQLDAKLKMGDIYRSIYKTSGVVGFWRGTGTNIAGRAVEECIFWMLYENAKRQCGTVNESSTVLKGLGIVGLSAACKLVGSTIAYPYNVVMTHLREVNPITNQHNFHSVPQVARHVYRSDGLRGFYAGLTPALLRSVPSKASQIFAFEMAMLAFHKLCCEPVTAEPNGAQMVAAH